MDAGRRLLLLLTLLAVPSSAVYAQRDLTEIPPPDPELERATFVLPPGFEVNLFAADPAIAKPIQMNFDTQGACGSSVRKPTRRLNRARLRTTRFSSSMTRMGTV